MSELNAQELRELPKKDTWSDAEALMLYERIDGFELCCGAPTPFYVRTREQRVRWAHCARIASIVADEPASGQLAGSTARAMYQDREQFTA
jgi:hypothetical protein